MHIEKGTSAAVVVKLGWADLQGVRSFLRQKEGDTNQHIHASDDSHVIFAKIVDSDSPFGLWINIEWRKSDSEIERRALLIPWSEVLTIVLGQTEDRVCEIGFTS